MEDTKQRRTIDVASGDKVEATKRKRGRPAKPKKQPVKPPSGRGRGRPAKITKNNSDDSNKATETNGVKQASAGRGRPRKTGKLKVTHQIVATGKGRGRPKKATTSDVEQSDENENDSDGN